MSITARWISGVLVFLLAFGWGASIFKQMSAAAETKKLTPIAQSYSAQEKELALQLGIDSVGVAKADEELKLKEKILERRTPYGEELLKVSEALASAKDKVSIEEEQGKILASQDRAVAATSPEAVDAETAEITAITGALQEKVKAYDAEQERLAKLRAAQSYSSGSSSGGSTGSSGTPAPSGDWFSQMRAILDSVGGGGVPLKQFGESGCGGVSEYACTWSTGTIVVGPAIANWSYGQKQWAMAHELAHVYQFRVWGALTSSGSYGNLFGGNPETLANCMAAVKGYYSSCSGAQMDFSRSMWNGSVPG